MEEGAVEYITSRPEVSYTFLAQGLSTFSGSEWSGDTEGQFTHSTDREQISHKEQSAEHQRLD